MEETERFDTVIVGAGQAGLAAGYHLARRGRAFVILDAGERVGDSWRKRWDSLRLFTPARYDGLPGWAFPARSWSYPTKDDVADYFAAYVAHFELPVRTGVTRGPALEGERSFRSGVRRPAVRGRQRGRGDRRVPEPQDPFLRARAGSGHRAAALQRVPEAFAAPGGRHSRGRRRELGSRDRARSVSRAPCAALGERHGPGAGRAPVAGRIGCSLPRSGSSSRAC